MVCGLHIAALTLAHIIVMIAVPYMWKSCNDFNILVH